MDTPVFGAEPLWRNGTNDWARPRCIWARAAAALVGEGGDRCGRRLKADRGGGLPETAACGAWWWRCYFLCACLLLPAERRKRGGWVPTAERGGELEGSGGRIEERSGEMDRDWGRIWMSAGSSLSAPPLGDV